MELAVHSNANSSNVLAFSGPAGVGKSDLISEIVRRNGKRFTIAEKDSLRPPKELEKRGRIPYSHISFWDVVNCSEPQLCSMNVGLCLEPKPEWLYWMKELELSKKGVFIPEAEEMVVCADHFINRYLLLKVKQQQEEALKHKRILLLEISCDLEKDFAELFPEMTVVRLYCARQTRVYRIIDRDKPNTHLKWTQTSLKILDSLSFPLGIARTEMNYYLKRNETRRDFEEILTWIEDQWGSASKRANH